MLFMFPEILKIYVLEWFVIYGYVLLRIYGYVHTYYLFFSDPNHPIMFQYFFQKLHISTNMSCKAIYLCWPQCR